MLRFQVKDPIRPVEMVPGKIYYLYSEGAQSGTLILHKDGNRYLVLSEEQEEYFHEVGKTFIHTYMRHVYPVPLSVENQYLPKFKTGGKGVRE